MIHLYYSNRTEALLDALVERVRARPSALEPFEVVVPNRHLERYVDIGIARALGVSANVRFVRLERFVRDWLARSTAARTVLDREHLEALVLAVLLDPTAMRDRELAPALAYLDAAGDDLDARDVRRVQLASRLARLYEEYDFSRPEMLDAWARGKLVLDGTSFAATERWERAMLRRARATAVAVGAPEALLHEALELARPGAARAPVHVFGVSYVARVFQRVLGELAKASELFVYTLNPCEEFWEDVRAVRPRDGDDPFGLLEDTDTPALRLWGRPGRESIRLLNDLGEGAFEARFVDPLATRGAHTLLERFQHDVLERAPLPAAPTVAPDGSIRVLGCRGPRREVEAVVEEIWRAVHADRALRGDAPPLRFNEIAVIVSSAGRDLYLPHLRAVLRAAHDVPHHVVDVPLASESRIVEAALLLVALPLGALTRPELLDVLTHPAVLSRTPDVDPSAWVDVVDELGVFRGADAADLAGTYVERDLWSWDQGMKRLALGRFLEGERSGETRAYEPPGGNRYFVEDRAAISDTHAGELLVLVRSLVADARFARTAELPLARWSVFLRELILAHVAPSSETESSELRRCLAVVASLGERPFGATPVRYRVAAELVRASLGDLAGGRGEYLADGVVISSFLPMRAIPFRHVFLLGLGEGRFPASDRRDTLDLRGARRQAGDVSPTERDRYLFLEALLCARDRLVVTYTSHEPETGDRLSPSPIVEELLGVLERGYVPSARDALVEAQVLRRFDAEGAPESSIPAVRREARAAALGTELRARTPGPVDLVHARSMLGPRWDDVASLLGHASPPAASSGLADDGTIRISLSMLRAFLECPLQGWARAVLRIERDEDDALEAVEDEPLSPSYLEAAILTRGALIDSRREGVPLMDAYARLAERREAAGRWPTGLVGAGRSRIDAQMIEAWSRELARIAGRDPSLTRFRFGSSSEHEDVDVVLPPILLDLPDPREATAGRGLRIEISGTTQPWADAPRAGVELAVTRGGTTKDSVAVKGWRGAMRIFIEHMALAASGHEPGVAHAAWVISPEGTSNVWALSPVAAERARRWLGTVVNDMLARSHAYFMPCEVPFLAIYETGQLSEASLAKSLHTALHGLKGGRSAYGPVRSATSYPPPSPAEALAMSQRRFGELFDLAVPLDSTTKGVAS